MPVKQRNWNPSFSTNVKVFDVNNVMVSNTTGNFGGNVGFHTHRRYFYRYYTNTPNYKTLRKSQGWLPTNILQGRRFGVDAGTFINCTYRRLSQPQTRVVIQGGYLNCPTDASGVMGSSAWTTRKAEIVSLLLDLQYGVLSKARDLKMMLPVTFYEGRKTVDMIKDNLNTLARSYRDFRKGKFKGAWKRLNRVHPFKMPTGKAANRWLEYRYGWLPLLYDVTGAVAILKQELFEPKAPRHSFVKNGGREYPLSTGWTYNDPLLTGYTNIVRYELKVSCKAKLYVENKYSTEALAAQLGVGLYDPLTTLWELIPFSFVFDWFVDVGSWLEARSSLQGFTVLNGFTAWEASFNCTSNQTRTTSLYNNPEKNVSWKFNVTEYERLPWNGAIIDIRTPLYDGLNAKRITDSASLWRQRLKGDRKPGKYRP